MQFLKVQKQDNSILLSTPNRNEILVNGPPTSSKCDILGKGAYGTVFKAIYKGKQVAGKIIKHFNDISMQTIENEAHIIGWNHSNIVKVLKIETTENFSIVIMEYFLGECLQTILNKIELPLIHRIYITLDIIAALTYCHDRNLLHLDVKPQNIFVSFGVIDFQQLNSRNYICKLCDFGASKLFQKSEETNSMKYLRYGGGTVRYMSPEFLRNENLTPAADIYSLGITMWQIKNRRIPYDWIQCNDIVAYQVVKHHLRPDSPVGNQLKNKLKFALNNCDKKNINHKCYCDIFHSEKSVHCRENLIKLLNETATNFSIDEASLSCVCHNRNRKKETRKPFQVIDATANNVKLNVARNLSSELGLISPLKRHQRNVEDVEKFDIFAIFRHFSTASSHEMEISFVNLYKSCWHSDLNLRPNLVNLRKSLEKFI